MNIKSFLEKKKSGEPLTMLTAYDYIQTLWCCAAGIDSILVGDSLGNVVQGKGTTLNVSLDEMIYHTEIVARIARQKCDEKSRPVIVADMPFPFGHTGIEVAVAQAARVIKDTGCDAVKVETSWEDASLVSALVKAGIPVMAHIGLRPQQILNLGKFSIQKAEKALLKDAEAVTDAGAFSVVLECVEADLAEKITRQVAIPTIGIGSGAGCDGQILVITDVLGMNPDFVPKHARQYAHLAQTAIDAIKEYVSDVKERKFP